MATVTLPQAGSWVLPKPFDGSAGCSLDTFLREYTDCLEVNGFVSVASGAKDSVDSTSCASITRMALSILKRSLTGSAAAMLESLSNAERSSRVEIERALNARFGDGEKVTVRQAELFSRKRLPGRLQLSWGMQFPY